MNELRDQERNAVEAVARKFSARWEQKSDSRDPSITVAGRPVALDIGTLKPRGAGQGKPAKPGLRFDKVATRLTQGLETALGKRVPDGMAVLLTITAPIRLPSKTAAALEDKIQTLLDRGPGGRDEKETIHGNRVQVRLLKDGSRRAPKMIGFVHNPDSDPLLLFNMTSELLELIGSKADEKDTRLRGDRWLVLISTGGAARFDAYRYIYSLLRRAAVFKKTIMVFDDGRIETLEG